MRTTLILLFCPVLLTACAGTQTGPAEAGKPLFRAVAACDKFEPCQTACVEKGSGAACYELGMLQLTQEMMRREEQGSMGETSAQAVYDAAQVEAPRVSFTRAVQILEKECNAANELSCFYLGRLCSEGWGAPPDQARALRLLDQACEGGVADACTRLGWQFSEGLAVAKDPPRALQYLERGCAGNHPQACHSAGAAYLHGTGAERDSDKGRSLLHKACQGGVAEACDEVGTLGD